MGIGTLGFLKGASKVALDSIDAREEAAREIKKEEARQRLKAKLDKELALATVTDKQYEERDGVLWMVGYNSNGSKVENSERPASPYEIEKRTAEKAEAEHDGKKKSLDLQKLEVDIENTQDTIRSRKDDDRRQAGLAGAQIGYYNRGNRPSSGGNSGGSLDTINLSDAPQLALSRAAEEVITVDPGISRLLGDYAIPANLVEVIKKDAIGQALRDPNAKSPAARAQLASTIMRRSILETGSRYPKE